MWKKLLKAFIFLSLFCIAAVLCLALFINEILATHKDRVAEIVGSALSSEVRFQNIRVGVRPIPGIRLEGLEIAPTNCVVPIVAESVHVTLNPWGLLSQKIELYTVTLIGPQLDLTFGAKGPALSARDEPGCLQAPAAVAEQAQAVGEERKKEKSPTDATEEGGYEISLDMLQVVGGNFRLRSAHSLLELSGLEVALHLREKSTPLSILHTGFEVSGKVALEELKHNDPQIRARALELKLELASRSPEQPLAVKGSVSLGATSIVDGGDSYQLASLNAPLKLVAQQDGSIKLTGSTTVTNFGFSDGETSLSKVSAALNKIKGDFRSNGDVVFSVDLVGNSIQLDNPSITIRGAERVTAPLSIKVPAAGGYEVSGPVEVVGAEINTLNKDFSSVAATVQMLVSGPLKDFSTKDLRYRLGEDHGQIGVRFAMTPERYLIEDGVLQLGTGRLSCSANVARDASRYLSAQLEISEVEVAQLARMYDPSADQDYSGILKSFRGQFSSRKDTLLKSLKGQGSVRIQQSVLKKKNLTERIFNAIKQIPPFNLITSPPKDEGKSTQELSSNFTIFDQVLQFNEILLKRDNYTLEGSGTLGFDKNMDFRLDVIFLRETAGWLGLGIGPLERLFRSVGKIRIPLIVDGKLPDFDIRADKKELAKRGSGLSLLDAGVDSLKSVGGAVGRVITGSEKEPDKED